MSDMDPNFHKEVIKEALKEWMDERFALFGKWTFCGVCSAALVGLVYLALIGTGWHR